MTVSAIDHDIDPLDILRVLTLHEVGYVLVGSLAAAVAGAPLATAEVEICYDRDPANLVALTQALTTLKVAQAPDHKSLVAGGRAWLGTKAGELQLIGIPEGTTGYADLARDSVQLDLGDGLRVRVAALGDQVRMAAASTRSIDRARLDILRAVQSVLEGDAH